MNAWRTPRARDGESACSFLLCVYAVSIASDSKTCRLPCAEALPFRRDNASWLFWGIKEDGAEFLFLELIQKEPEKADAIFYGVLCSCVVAHGVVFDHALSAFL